MRTYQVWLRVLIWAGIPALFTLGVLAYMVFRHSMRTLSFALVCLVASSAAAEPILLATIEHQDTRWDTNPDGLWMDFAAYNPAVGPGLYFGREYFHADAGQIFETDAITTQAAAVCLVTADCQVSVGTGGFNSNSFPITALWSGEVIEDMHLTQLQASVGSFSEFQSYEITRITRTVDVLATRLDGRYWIADGQQTLRLYGELRPVYPPLVGDYNKNGEVDAADYVVWRKAMVANALLPPGTAPNLTNGYGDPHPAGEVDYLFWRVYFGQSVSPVGAATAIGAGGIPEPGGLLSFTIGLLLVHVSRLGSRAGPLCRC